MAWLSNIFSFIANSKPAQIVLAVIGALLAFKTVQWKARMDGEKEADRRNERIRQEQINSQRQEAQERVEAFTEAARAVERLPEPELRKSTEADPNNRGRVPRD